MIVPLRKIIIVMALGCMVLFFSTHALALGLSFSPSSSTINQGSQITVDLMIDSEDEIFSTLDIYIDFDTSIIDIIGFGFYSDAINAMDPANDSTSYAYAPPGLPDPYYIELYATPGPYYGHFLAYSGHLAWITFEGEQVGTTDLFFRTDKSDFRPSDATLTEGTITVTQNAVPEPTIMLLLGSGLVGLAGFRKKVRKK